MAFDGQQTRHHSLLNRLPLAFILIAFSDSKWSAGNPSRVHSQPGWGVITLWAFVCRKIFYYSFNFRAWDGSVVKLDLRYHRLQITPEMEFSALCLLRIPEVLRVVHQCSYSTLSFQQAGMTQVQKVNISLEVNFCRF